MTDPTTPPADETADYPLRVVAGAAYLDRERPDWADRINLDTLDMRDLRLCVLGQVFGDYYAAGLVTAGSGQKEWRRAQGLGFNLYPHRYDIAPLPTEAEWEALTAAWRNLITDRRTGQETTP